MACNWMARSLFLPFINGVGLVHVVRKKRSFNPSIAPYHPWLDYYI